MYNLSKYIYSSVGYSTEELFGLIFYEKNAI